MSDLAVYSGPSGRPEVEMRLWCWQHKANHTLPLADVERIVYALGWHSINNNWMPGAWENRVEQPHPLCPLFILSWAVGEGAYAEHVEQGVECRAAAGEWTA